MMLSHSALSPLTRLAQDVERLKREAGFTSFGRDGDLLFPSASSLGGAASSSSLFQVNPRSNAYELVLDVAGYEPQDLEVNLCDDTITVSGKHEEKSPDGSSYVSRKFTRKYQLPSNVSIEAVKSNLSPDTKTLRIEAPLLKPLPPPMDPSQPIPIAVKRQASVQQQQQPQ